MLSGGNSTSNKIIELHMPEEVYRKLELTAREKGINFNQLVVDAFTIYLALASGKIKRLEKK